MAHCRTQLPVHCAAQELDHLVKAAQHVVLVCDWSNLRHTGEVPIEARSGESMARSDTRAQRLFQQLGNTMTQRQGQT